MPTTRRKSTRMRRGSHQIRDLWRDFQAGFGADCLGGIDPEDLAVYWSVFAGEITSSWIARHPGTRPWAWWDTRGLHSPSWDDQLAELLHLGEVDQTELGEHDRLEAEWNAYLATVPGPPPGEPGPEPPTRPVAPPADRDVQSIRPQPWPCFRVVPGTPRRPQTHLASIVAGTSIQPAGEHVAPPWIITTPRGPLLEASTSGPAIAELAFNSEITRTEGTCPNLIVEAYPVPFFPEVIHGLATENFSSRAARSIPPRP